MSLRRSPARDRVVHVTSVHSPADVRIWEKECATLSAAGFDVVLVAPGEPLRHESVRTVSVAKPRSRWTRMFVTTWVVVVRALQQRGAVYHFHDPELLPLAFILGLGGKKVVYDAHEDLPDQVATKDWVPALLRRPVGRLMDLAMRVFVKPLSGVVAATPTIANRFKGCPTVVVRNYPLLREFSEEPSYPRGGHSVVYVGSVTVERGAHEMAEAFGEVHNPDARLKVAGPVHPFSLETTMRECRGAERVDLLGWQDRASVAALLAEARAGLVVLHPTPSYLLSIPVKLFEYMAAGMPVVASNFPMWREYVEEPGTGIAVDPMSATAIGAAVDWIFEHPEEAEEMGRRGRAMVEDRWNWEPEGKRLVEFYNSILGGD